MKQQKYLKVDVINFLIKFNRQANQNTHKLHFGFVHQEDLVSPIFIVGHQRDDLYLWGIIIVNIEKWSFFDNPYPSITFQKNY